MTLDELKTDEDILDEENGVFIVTKKELSKYLQGATVDYEKSYYGGDFKIRTSNYGGIGGSRVNLVLEKVVQVKENADCASH